MKIKLTIILLLTLGGLACSNYSDCVSVPKGDLEACKRYLNETLYNDKALSELSPNEISEITRKRTTAIKQLQKLSEQRENVTQNYSATLKSSDK